MKKDRKVRFPAFERLSARAQALVIEGIEKDLTQVQIIAKVADEAGEEISSGSIGRFVENWRLQRESEQASDKQAKRIIEGIKAADIQGTEVGEMLIKHGLFENADQAGTLDLGDLLRHARQYEELKIRNRQLDQTDDKIRLLEREVGLREERLKEIRGKAQRIGNAVRAAEEKVRAGRQLDLDDFSGMRELYGFEALTEVPSAA